MGAPSAENCSPIWIASSRVGVSTTPKIPNLRAGRGGVGTSVEMWKVLSDSSIAPLLGQDATCDLGTVTHSGSGLARVGGGVEGRAGFGNTTPLGHHHCPMIGTATHGSLDSVCNIGSAKAAVLPEPVLAYPQQSWPASAQDPAR